MVVLQALEALGQEAEQRVAPAVGRELDPVPADLRLGGPAHHRAGQLGQQLRAEADAEHGRAAVDQLAHELLLGAQPGVGVLLVDLRLGAEHDRGVEAVERGRRRLVREPLDELVLAGRLGEHARRRVAVVYDRGGRASG